MKHHASYALTLLAPGAEWTMENEDYSTLVWHDSNGNAIPSDSDVQNKIAELDSDEPLRLLRVERDKKLADLDWEVVRATTQGVAIDSDLKVYMQALRDLPSNSSPTIDSAGELVTSSFTWPTR